MSKTDAEINVLKCMDCVHVGFIQKGSGLSDSCRYYNKPLSDKPYEIDCEQDTCDGFGPIYYRPGTCRKYKSRDKESEE